MHRFSADTVSSKAIWYRHSTWTWLYTEYHLPKSRIDFSVNPLNSQLEYVNPHTGAVACGETEFYVVHIKLVNKVEHGSAF